MTNEANECFQMRVLYSYNWPRGPMDKAPDYESGDSMFESWRGQNFLFTMLLHLVVVVLDIVYRLQFLTIEVLIDRLVYRRQYLLARKICQYLKLKDVEVRILAHWACYKVQCG